MKHLDHKHTRTRPITYEPKISDRQWRGETFNERPFASQVNPSTSTVKEVNRIVTLINSNQTFRDEFINQSNTMRLTNNKFPFQAQDKVTYEVLEKKKQEQMLLAL